MTEEEGVGNLNMTACGLTTALQLYTAMNLSGYLSQENIHKYLKSLFSFPTTRIFFTYFKHCHRSKKQN